LISNSIKWKCYLVCIGQDMSWPVYFHSYPTVNLFVGKKNVNNIVKRNVITSRAIFYFCLFTLYSHMFNDFIRLLTLLPNFCRALTSTYNYNMGSTRKIWLINVLLKYNNSVRTCALEIRMITTVAFIENLIEFRVTNSRFTFPLNSYCLTVLLYRNWNIFTRFLALQWKATTKYYVIETLETKKIVLLRLAVVVSNSATSRCQILYYFIRSQRNITRVANIWCFVLASKILHCYKY